MRIILLPQIVRVYPLPEDEASYTLETFSGDVRVFESSIQVTGYDTWFWNRRSVAYQGEAYRVDCSKEGTPSDSAIKSGMCLLVDSNGNPPALSPELQYLLIQSHDPRYRENITNGNKVFGILFDEDTYDLQSVLGDFSNGTFTATSDVRMAGKSILLDDRVLGYDSKTDQLTCLDHDLKPLWQFKPEQRCLARYATAPIITGGLVIQNFGPSESWTTPGPIEDGRKTQDVVHRGEGLLCAVEIESGDVRWKRVVPNAIDSMTTSGSQLIVCSVNELHVLDAATGQMLQVVSTGLSDDYDRNLNVSFVHLKDRYVFFAHPADACVLVYTLDGFDLVRRIDIPEPYTVKELLNGSDYVAQKLFFELQSRSARAHYHMSPILEIDIGLLDSEVETLSGPPVEIDLRPSANNPEHVEVWISMKDVLLDEAMLYAELHTENQAYYHGRQGAHLASVHLTENFNGRVHFEYSGGDRPATEVEERFAILKTRFAKWASDEAFASTDPVPKEDVSLDVVYLDEGS